MARIRHGALYRLSRRDLCHTPEAGSDGVGMSTPEQDPPARAHVWIPPARGARTTAAIAVLAIVAILAILWAWNLPPFGGGVEVTDNAYVRGRTAVIAPQVSGYVDAVLVRDYDQVCSEQILVRIDDRIYRARVAQAQATLAAQ